MHSNKSLSQVIDFLDKVDEENDEWGLDEDEWGLNEEFSSQDTSFIK